MANSSTCSPRGDTHERYGPCRMPADARAPGTARRWISLLDDARARHKNIGLVASELVTNAVVHTTCPEIVVTVVVGSATTRLEVSDCDPAHPRVLEGTVGGRPAGLGLRVVDAVAARWGVEPLPPGKTVWAEFDAA